MALDQDDMEFDRRLREKLDAGEAHVPDFAWDNIRTELDRRRRKPVWLPYAVAAMLLLGALGTYSLMDSGTLNRADENGMAYENTPSTDRPSTDELPSTTNTPDAPSSADEGDTESSSPHHENKATELIPGGKSAQPALEQGNSRNQVRRGVPIGATAGVKSKNSKKTVENSEGKELAEGNSQTPTSVSKSMDQGKGKKSMTLDPSMDGSDGRKGEIVSERESLQNQDASADSKVNGGEPKEGEKAVAKNEDGNSDSQTGAGELPTEDSLLSSASDTKEELAAVVEEEEEEPTPEVSHIYEAYFAPQYAFRRASANTGDQLLVNQLDRGNVEIERIGYAVGARYVRANDRQEWYGGLSVRKLNDRLKLRIQDRADVVSYETVARPDNLSAEVTPHYQVYEATEVRDFAYLGAEGGYSYLAGEKKRIRLTGGIGVEYLIGDRVTFEGIRDRSAAERFSAMQEGRSLNVNVQFKAGYLLSLSENMEMALEPMLTYYVLSAGKEDQLVQLSPFTVGLNVALRFHSAGKP